jgi:hypothetical protein
MHINKYNAEIFFIISASRSFDKKNAHDLKQQTT